MYKYTYQCMLYVASYIILLRSQPARIASSSFVVLYNNNPIYINISIATILPSFFQSKFGFSCFFISGKPICKSAPFLAFLENFSPSIVSNKLPSFPVKYIDECGDITEESGREGGQ